MSSSPQPSSAIALSAEDMAVVDRVLAMLPKGSTIVRISRAVPAPARSNLARKRV